MVHARVRVLFRMVFGDSHALFLGLRDEAGGSFFESGYFSFFFSSFLDGFLSISICFMAFSPLAQEFSAPGLRRVRNVLAGWPAHRVFQTKTDNTTGFGGTS